MEPTIDDFQKWKRENLYAFEQWWENQSKGFKGNPNITMLKKIAYSAWYAGSLSMIEVEKK